LEKQWNGHQRKWNPATTGANDSDPGQAGGREELDRPRCA
jgi:hypothetical protein